MDTLGKKYSKGWIAMNQKRCYSLDVLKLFLAYVVAFGHVKMPIRPGSTVSVQIFFILSGFFLAKKFYSREETYSAWDYTLDHVRSIYPHYAFSCTVLFLYIFARSCLEVIRHPGYGAVKEVFLLLYNQIPDIFLLQSAYHWHESLNYPLWQISALLIAGYFVFALLRRDEKLARTILFPAAILMGMSILESDMDLFANYGPIYLPLLRAFYPMCVGVLTWKLVSSPAYSRLKSHRIAFDAASVLALAGMIRYADYGNIFVITVPLLILNCWDADSVMNRIFGHNVFRHCGKLSYGIYLNQVLIARIIWALLLPRVNLPLWAAGSLYFVTLTAYSVFTVKLVDAMISMYRRKSKIGRLG